MLKNIEKIPLLCLLTRRYDYHSLARTTLSRTNFHGPEGVRAIEVLLYFYGANLGPPGAGPSWTLGPSFERNW